MRVSARTRRRTRTRAGRVRLAGVTRRVGRRARARRDSRRGNAPATRPGPRGSRPRGSLDAPAGRPSVRRATRPRGRSERLDHGPTNANHPPRRPALPRQRVFGNGFEISDIRELSAETPDVRMIVTVRTNDGRSFRFDSWNFSWRTPLLEVQVDALLTAFEQRRARIATQSLEPPTGPSLSISVPPQTR